MLGSLSVEVDGVVEPFGESSRYVRFVDVPLPRLITNIYLLGRKSCQCFHKLYVNFLVLYLWFLHEKAREFVSLVVLEADAVNLLFGPGRGISRYLGFLATQLLTCVVVYRGIGHGNGSFSN